VGDENRGQVFALWIVRNFPRAKNILDIAGGKGQVARKLANKGKSVHVIDAKPRFEGRNHPLISYQRGWFTEDTEVDVPDLIVGMHPDEATGEIIRYATKHRIPFAVVPCCVKGRDAVNISKFSEWKRKLSRMAKFKGFEVFEGLLKMRGKNTVLKGIPKGEI